MKKIIIIIILLIIVAVGAYVVFILKSGEELNEISPLLDAGTTPAARETKVKDKLESMTAEEMNAFRQEVEEMRDIVMEKEEAMPVGAELFAQGDFMRQFHNVAGRALLIKENSRHILRFEDFETDNGPRLHIYLSAGLGDDDFIDLGPIRATKGNANYEVPAGVDIEKYRNVLVWCVPFGVLFSYAELN